ncbi:MAG: glycogen-binding domain-containing protein [Bacteroidales bacterium]
MIYTKFKITAALILVSLLACGQSNPKNACTIVNERLVFSYNLNWSDNQKSEFIELFDIDSTVLQNAIKGNSVYTVDGVEWKSKKISSTTIEFSKALNQESTIQKSIDYLMLSLSIINRTLENADAVSASYGINKFKSSDCFQYRNGIAQFYLPGNLSARNVYISGTFNDWSTRKTPMQKIESGWVVNLKLQPGKHLYKYIIDGRWTHDPNNEQKERNEHDSYNSVAFCYNYKFTLDSYTNARKVFLAGSFNNWNPRELSMNKTALGWELPMFLNEGSHTYKFVVDNNWILDPKNKISKSDGKGNINSFIGIGNEYTFKLKGYLSANSVYVAGNFNGWNSGELLMQKTKDGWILPYNLGKGNYEYKFIVDGQWITDPDNSITIGSGNVINSVLSIEPNHTFKVNRFSQAKTVIVSGSFNGWSHDGYKMKKTKDGWILPIYLKPSKYTYKLIVDGEWILDPENSLWEQNEYGNGNSVLWINP